MVTPFGKEDVNRNRQKNDNGSQHNTTKYVTLKDVHILLLKEVQLPTLQPIPLDTYKTIAATIEKLKQQKYDGMDASVRDRIVKLICVSAELLLDVRYHKLLEQYSAHKNKNDRLSLRDSAIIPAPEYSKLTDEEKYILDAEKQTKKRKMAIVAATLQGRPKVLESISSRIMSKRLVLVFVKPMEQFIGVDMAKYGPFREEDVAVIPSENARSLMENGIAVELDVQLNT